MNPISVSPATSKRPSAVQQSIVANATQYTEPGWMTQYLPKLMAQSGKDDVKTGFWRMLVGKLPVIGGALAEAKLQLLNMHDPYTSGYMAVFAGLGVAATALFDTQAIRYLNRGLSRIN